MIVRLFKTSLDKYKHGHASFSDREVVMSELLKRLVLPSMGTSCKSPTSGMICPLGRANGPSGADETIGTSNGNCGICCGLTERPL